MIYGKQPTTELGAGASTSWDYAADGRKVKYEGIDDTKEYMEGIEYRNNDIFIYHPEGRVLKDSTGEWVYEYSLKDHLGNTRVVFADLDGTITDSTEVLHEAHYYPFGMEMEGPWNRQRDTLQPYLYNGKEFHFDSLDVDGDQVKELALGWYDYGARFYDPAVGRFTSIDPLADQMPSWSPYNYVENNPIRFIDPDGRMAVDALAPLDDYRLNHNGTIELIRTTNDANDQLFSTHLDGELTGESIEVPKGVLQEFKENERGGTDLGGKPFSSVEIANNDQATEVFEFMSENTIVEFSHVKFDKEGNAISTSHEALKEGGGTKMAYDKLSSGSKVKSFTHSHPTDGPPSGADLKSAAYWNSLGVSTRIYKGISKSYIDFNSKGEKK